MKKHVSRAHCGSMCAKYAHAKVKHACCIEQKIIVDVLKTQAQSQKAKQTKNEAFLSNKNKN